MMQSENFASDLSDVLRSMQVRDHGGDEAKQEQAHAILKTHYEEYNEFLKSGKGCLVIDNAVELAQLDRQQREIKCSFMCYHIKQGSQSRKDVAELKFDDSLVLIRDTHESLVLGDDNLTFMPLCLPSSERTKANSVSRLQLLLVPVKEDQEEKLQVLHFGGKTRVHIHYGQDETLELKQQELKICYVQAPCTIRVGIAYYKVQTADE